MHTAIGWNARDEAVLLDERNAAVRLATPLQKHARPHSPSRRRRPGWRQGDDDDDDENDKTNNASDKLPPSKDRRASVIPNSRPFHRHPPRFLYRRRRPVRMRNRPGFFKQSELDSTAIHRTNDGYIADIIIDYRTTANQQRRSPQLCRPMHRP